jgi:TorA maturation chaperone TorD
MNADMNGSIYAGGAGTAEAITDAPRAALYRLLGGLLAAPASAALLDALAQLPVPASDPALDDTMMEAWERLKRAAEEAEPAAVDDEFHELFIGVSRGELMPYGSWYQSGSIMSLPLARLRRDLAALGIEREKGIFEPEDHVSALCDAMSLLIENANEIPLDVQRGFFAEHVGRWMGRFFGDLERSPAARFYAAVGAVGARFVALEQQYFELASESAEPYVVGTA